MKVHVFYVIGGDSCIDLEKVEYNPKAGARKNRGLGGLHRTSRRRGTGCFQQGDTREPRHQVGHQVDSEGAVKSPKKYYL